MPSVIAIKVYWLGSFNFMLQPTVSYYAVSRRDGYGLCRQLSAYIIVYIIRALIALCACIMGICV